MVSLNCSSHVTITKCIIIALLLWSLHSPGASHMSGVGLSTWKRSFRLSLLTILCCLTSPPSTFLGRKWGSERLRTLLTSHGKHVAETGFKSRPPKSVLSTLGIYNTGRMFRMVCAAKKQKWCWMVLKSAFSYPYQGKDTLILFLSLFF